MQINALDISPQFAALVHAIMNTGGQLTGWLAPISLGWMTQYPEIRGHSWSREQWEQQQQQQQRPATGTINETSQHGQPAAAVVAKAAWPSLDDGAAPPELWLAQMRDQWSLVFLLASAVYVVGWAVYVRWGKGERQHWDIIGRL